MFTLEGDGSLYGTSLKLRGKEVAYDCIVLTIDPEESILTIDTSDASINGSYRNEIDFICIKGLYTIIGNGEFTNTRVFVNEEMMRGIQTFTLIIDTTTYINFDAVLLPNIVLNDDELIDDEITEIN